MRFIYSTWAKKNSLRYQRNVIFILRRFAARRKFSPAGYFFVFA